MLMSIIIGFNTLNIIHFNNFKNIVLNMIKMFKRIEIINRTRSAKNDFEKFTNEMCVFYPRLFSIIFGSSTKHKD